MGSFEVSRRDLIRYSLLTGAAAAAARLGRAQSALSNVALSGARELPARLIPVRCGSLEFLFDPKLAFVRYIKWQGVEVIRGIYAAVRDQVWGTVAPQVSNLIVTTESDSFRLRFDVECRQGPVDFAWTGTVEGAPRELRFLFEGEARQTFLRNRIGFCVLHPLAECAGKPCRIDQVDGKVVNGTFPRSISPHQPFKGIKIISHSLMEGVSAEVRFAGDTFEMEDHRNWTDGNYKTYCTPLELPFPVEVKKGTRIEQNVAVRIAGNPKAAVFGGGSRSARVVISAAPNAPAAKTFPEIGLGLAADAPPLTANQGARLAGLARHLRVDLKLYESDWEKLFDRAVNESAALRCGLEAAVFVSDRAEQELASLAKTAATKRARIARWLVFHQNEASTKERWLKLARVHLKGAPIGSGTNQYFTELNCERPDPSWLDVACYSLNPQVHAFDSLSLAENLSAQADTVATARDFLGSKPLAITPVTFKPRFNPQAKVQPPVPPGTLPPRIDPRQMSLYGAAWTLGSIKYLAEAGANSITYYETHGWAGLMETDKGAALPELFPSAAGAVFPLFHVLRDVAGAASITPTQSSDPLAVVSLLFEHAGGSSLLLANLTDQQQVVKLDAGPKGNQWGVRVLDAESYEEATKQPSEFRSERHAAMRWETIPARRELALQPYATLRLVGITG